MTRTETAPGAAGAVIAGHRVELLDRARVYACGITPYDVTHLGHAATFVWIDALGRVLRFLGVQPEVCRNVTDVDDVLDAAAGRAGAAYDEFAAIQQFQFDRDMAAVGVRSPEHEPRAHRGIAIPRQGFQYGLVGNAVRDRREPERIGIELASGIEIRDTDAAVCEKALHLAIRPSALSPAEVVVPGRSGLHPAAADCDSILRSVRSTTRLGRRGMFRDGPMCLQIAPARRDC